MLRNCVMPIRIYNSKQALIIWIISLSIVVTGCTSLLNYEICEVNGEVFTTIVNNSAEWLTYFETNPTTDELIIMIDEKSYVVRRYVSVDGFFISTNEGYGSNRTMPGLAGYYYSASGNPRAIVFGYEDEHVRDNIYCYRKT